jgi:hypothetical protein
MQRGPRKKVASTPRENTERMSRARKSDLVMTYQVTSASPEEIERRIERAFDILFGATLKRYPFNQKKHE